MEAQRQGQDRAQPDIIAKSAQVIADGAGISIPEGTDILLVEGMEPILGDKFHDEKISPVLTVYKAKDFKDAYRILVELTNLVGAATPAASIPTSTSTSSSSAST